MFLKTRRIRFIFWFPVLVIILYIGIDFSLANVSKISPNYMYQLNDILKQRDQYSNYKDVKLVDYVKNTTILYVPFYNKIYQLIYDPALYSSYSFDPVSFEETPLRYKDFLFNQDNQSLLILEEESKVLSDESTLTYISKLINKDIRSETYLRNIGINENTQQMYGFSEIFNYTTSQYDFSLHNLNFDSNITEVESDHSKLLETGYYNGISKIIVNPENNDIYVIHGSKIFVLDESFNIKFTYSNPSRFIDIDVINNEVYLTSNNGLIIIDEVSKIDEIRFKEGLNKISANFDPKEDKVFFSSLSKSNRIFEFDVLNKKIINSIDVKGKIMGLVLLPTPERLLVIMSSPDSIQEFNVAYDRYTTHLIDPSTQKVLWS
jgi:hypothetical protein